MYILCGGRMTLSTPFVCSLSLPILFFFHKEIDVFLFLSLGMFHYTCLFFSLSAAL